MNNNMRRPTIWSCGALSAGDTVNVEVGLNIWASNSHINMIWADYNQSPTYVALKEGDFPSLATFWCEAV